jgi:hypothetical protein
MKRIAAFGITLLSAIAAFSQSQVIVTNTLPSPKPIATPIIVGQPIKPAPTPQVIPQVSNLNKNGIAFSQIKSKLAEARRYLVARPLTIASAEPVNFTTIIRVAFYDMRTRQIDSYVLTKDQFLGHGLTTAVVSASGKTLFSKTIRGNGVNTPVIITDQNGNEHYPLMVQYPRENRGVFSEMAYYVSSHPELITPEVVNAGKFYVRNTIDVAREQLRTMGYPIQPKIADMAERLATVEHVDHLRFRTELHGNIYNDIFTLFALNEGQTYRYSVSSAGAGGMVQMIAPTYRMVRARFPNANLMPDFVEGMRNHVNACRAMLLYMQMTWNDLAASPAVQNALALGWARPEHLMAAGYNSNPARLPGYINRGGQDWATLIPRETKIYLQIWDSLERNVSLSPRKQ